MNLIVLQNLEELEQRQLFNNRRNARNPFDLSETQFINMFRLSKILSRYLINILGPLMRPKLRPTDLDIQTKVSKLSTCSDPV
jgi:hypothetical protein